MSQGLFFYLLSRDLSEGSESSLYDVYHILLNKSIETINLSHSSVSKAKYGNFSDHARFEGGHLSMTCALAELLTQ